VHVLVHCAGTIAIGTTGESRAEDLNRLYRINLLAPYLLTRGLLPNLTACAGQIVFVNSSAGLRAREGAAQYAATKHALRGFADSLRDEVNEDGVRVVSLFLGRTAGKVQAAVFEREGRPYDPSQLMQPDDVASVIAHTLGLPRTAEVTDIWLRSLKKS
jgi:short-subunit dehydrogenase